MLLLVSDIHGSAQLLRKALLAAPGPFVGLLKPDPKTGVCQTTGPGTLVIQLGDHSFGPEVSTHHFFEPWDPGIPVHFLHGNHDYEPALQGRTVPAEIYPNLIFLPDGLIIEHEGRRIGILGGADSVIDLKYRVRDVDHWASEAVCPYAVKKLVASEPLDILLTHTAPAALIKSCLGYPPSPSEVLLDKASLELGHPPIFCGHIHSAHTHENATVLAFGAAGLVDLSTLDFQPL